MTAPIRPDPQHPRTVSIEHPNSGGAVEFRSTNEMFPETVIDTPYGEGASFRSHIDIPDDREPTDATSTPAPKKVRKFKNQEEWRAHMDSISSGGPRAEWRTKNWQ